MSGRKHCCHSRGHLRDRVQNKVPGGVNTDGFLNKNVRQIAWRKSTDISFVFVFFVFRDNLQTMSKLEKMRVRLRLTETGLSNVHSYEKGIQLRCADDPGNQDNTQSQVLNK